jgi:catechol 2,3-dioxygenase-like lactoylglutathione lyase family enzyme
VGRLIREGLGQLVEFYEHKLGLRLIERAEKFCIFDAGADTHFEIWANGLSVPGRKSPHEQSMIIGFLFEQLEPVVAELKARGLNPDTAINSYLGTRWIYYTDTEGNRFELKDNNSESGSFTDFPPGY